MFIAEVLAINADEKYIDEKGAFDISKCDLIAYANGGYYELGKKIGKFGYSVEKKKTKEANAKKESYKKENKANTIKKVVKKGVRKTEKTNKSKPKTNKKTK